MMHQATFRILGSILLLNLALGCSLFGPLRHDERAKGYSFQKPGAWWKKQEAPKVEHLFENSKTGALLAINSLCDRYETSRLETLAKELAGPLRDVEVLSQETENVDGRDMLIQNLSGTLDGVTVEFWIAVVRKDDCLFDFQMTRSPELDDSAQKDFLNLVRSFQYSGGMKR